MPTVDSTNSYVTEAEATDYFDERLYATAWTGADEAEQRKALLMARRLLDLHMAWRGEPASDSQPLAWPRVGISGLDADEVPDAVKTAQMELALILLGTNLTALPDTAGFKSIQMDTIKLDVDAWDRVKIIPPTILSLLSHLGSLKSEPGAYNVTR